jgi:hypothetical protein
VVTPSNVQYAVVSVLDCVVEFVTPRLKI